ncbi:hypothetical protein [Ralstonia pseudosolanacearum]|uniref:Uncharacterized protein n=1 Tax=Ralstonia solanacearum TaxID=305 RepID=A0AA92ED66_RALSL|nr:hypothetical protein [Ralstonia pseudosolanacearum]QCX49869.1 hypothetical protein E7Z57_12725 [Ralstonia pseudosolanacearum]
MALTVFTKESNALLKAIRKAIDEKKVETWAYDADGDFYHTPDQWRGKAWFRPHEIQGVLSFWFTRSERSKNDKNDLWNLPWSFFRDATGSL